jgi:hypothetical protein
MRWWIVVPMAGAFSAGCEPGAVHPRSGTPTGAAGSAGPVDRVVVVRDAGAGVSAPIRGGTGGAGGRGGAGGARMVPDAGAPASLVDAAKAAAVDATPDAPIFRAPRAGELAVDELLVNPTGDDLGREWIEITNRATESLDLSTLHLATATVDVAAAAGVIAPGALRLLGQSADSTKNGGLTVDTAYGTKLILVNADGQLSICAGACVSGVVIDTVSWGTLGDAFTGHALIVDPVTKVICPAETPFGTAGSFGTPGATNPICIENADGGSLGDVSDAD